MSKDEQQYFTGANSLQAYGSQQLSSDDVIVPRGSAKTMAYSLSGRTFVGHDTNISVKSDYNYRDFEYFRGSQAVPERPEEIIEMCMMAARKVGLVKNVLDLMGDFGSQGIRIQHPNPRVQKFYNSWATKVEFNERSERFLNQLYRQGQVIIKRSYGKVSQYQERKWKRGVAKDEVTLDKVKVNAREIPLKYRFINPLSVEIVASDLAQFVGMPALGLKISPKLRASVTQALAAEDKMAPTVKKMLAKIPKDVLEAIKRGDRVLPLDPDRISVSYYKKDDWALWADPLCYCILEDLLMLNQLKLADRSALDGAISNIRLWTLGILGDSPATSIMPTKALINKLRNILANNVGGGVMDLVWGPELSFSESNSQVWRWLGSEKYEITINNIYEGLGIPVSLRAGGGSTNTGNFIGLNTLVKRLQYGRNKLTDFWNGELKYIHKAMGFEGEPPEIMFDFMALADEPAERKLLIELWDRDIISDNTILELFGRLPKVEKQRVKTESKDRTMERMPYKASPYHNPQPEHEYRKILLQGGGVAPSEIGIDLNDRKEGEPTRLEQMEQTQLKLKELDIKKQKEAKPPGSAGRPPNVTETKKRKPKPTERPSTNAFDIFMWSSAALEAVSHVITPALLDAYGKKDMRSLSKKEFTEIENIKFNILCSFEPFSEVSHQKIYDGLMSNNISDNTKQVLAELKRDFVETNQKEPRVEDLRQMYSIAYTLLQE
jgi:hypothetical protein